MSIGISNWALRTRRKRHQNPMSFLLLFASIELQLVAKGVRKIERVSSLYNGLMEPHRRHITSGKGTLELQQSTPR